MKAINMPLEDEYHEALELIQQHYSKLSGVKLTKVQALKRLLYETSNVIKNTGKLWSWEGNGAEGDK